MIPGTKYSPEQLVATVLRHRSVLIGGLVLGAMAAAGAATLLPKSYKSEAVILVVPQRVPDGYIKPIVAAKIEDRVKTISQEILGRTWLQRIIEEQDLYPELRRAGRLEDAINRMRTRDVKVQFVKGDAFQISFSGHDAAQAHRVASRLASDFVNANMKDRGDVADATVGLLDAELKEKKQQLEDSERKLEEYRRLHAGELPTQLGANQQVLQNLQIQVQTVIDSINRDRDRRIAAQRELADLSWDRNQVERATTTGSTTVASTETVSEAQMAEAETALRDLLTRYKDTHPDVAAARRRVRELQAKVTTERQIAANRPADAPVPMSAAARAQQARARQLQNDIDNIDRQLAARQADETRLRGVMGDVQRRIDAAPTRETELVALTRDYQTLNQMYVNLLSRIQDAKLAAKVENGTVGEQFKVIDPARVPGAPYFPDVPLFGAAGAVVGLGLAVLMVAFVEYRDLTLKTEEDVLSSIGLPVIALIPVLTRPVEAPAGGRMRKLLQPWRGAAVLLCGAAVSAAQFLVESVTSIG